jgi:hypothetical protein
MLPIAIVKGHTCCRLNETVLWVPGDEVQCMLSVAVVKEEDMFQAERDGFMGTRR